MITDSHSALLHSNQVRQTILENRSCFSTYNIARLRELLRYLSDEKKKMFYTIPLLLHINTPGWAGYIEDEHVPHGISVFYDSGFWKLAKRRLGIGQEDLRRFVPRRCFIKGVYLMGSAGSLGQTEYSDLDYWIVLDESKMGSAERGLLRKKLRLIEQWSQRRFEQKVTFFMLDAQQMRQNDFSGVAEEGFQIGLRTLLKEEFYRSFILIAGQIPFWTVLPSGLSDSEYTGWIKAVSNLAGDGFYPDDYVDFSNLSAISKGECLGAILWQFCKAQDDPIKAFIKASLIAHHRLFQGEDGLLCDLMKQRMGRSQLDSYVLDSNALSFERVMCFYEKTEDPSGLDIVKECICLSITGFPTPSYPTSDNPKKWLFEKYMREWSWSDSKIKRFLSLPSWPETERLQYEDGITKKLWFLYRMLLRMDQGSFPETEGLSACLAALRNKASSRLKKKNDKLPWASSYLRTRRVRFYSIGCLHGSWGVYDDSSRGVSTTKPLLFSAHELLRVLGWMILNGLYTGDPTSVAFQRVQSPIPPQKAKQLLEALYEHFSGPIDPSRFREREPTWRKLFVLLDKSRSPDSATLLPSADILLQNTWGEFFFKVIDLRPIENQLLKYNEISKMVWKVRPADDQKEFFRLFDIRTVGDLSAERNIWELVVERGRRKTAKESHEGSLGVERPPETAISGDGVILDMF